MICPGALFHFSSENDCLKLQLYNVGGSPYTEVNYLRGLS
jgi:hypothetical protein